MSMRLLINELQTGATSRSRPSLIPIAPILKLNTAEQLLNFLSIASFNGNTKGNLTSTRSDNRAVIVISHQPTFFPYSGVYVQFLLSDYLAKSLREKYDIEATIVYLCLDTDDANDRRIKTSHIPFPGTKNGSIPISFKTGKFYRNVPQMRVPFLDHGYKNQWIDSIVGNFNTLISLLPESKIELRRSQINFVDHLDSIYGKVIATNPISFSDFSLGIILFFIKDLIETPIIPIRFSELFSKGKESVLQILLKWEEITRVGTELLNHQHLSRPNFFQNGPAWIVCNACNNRNTGHYDKILDAFSGKSIDYICLKCGKKIANLDTDFVITPKVILEDLSGILLTNASLVLTYAGSAEHVVFSNAIFQEVFGKPAPIYTWHPKQFLGSPLEKAAFELIRKKNKAASAKRCLSLSLEGRDSLLFLFQFSNINFLTNNWINHFQSNQLSLRMISDCAYDLSYMFNNF